MAQDLLHRLQWRHLRLLQAIDECRQLSQAADRLAMTQPAASRMLAEVEAMVGAPLFQRTPRGMAPTPIAQVLIRHAAGLLRDLSAAVKEVSAFGEGKVGSVRVGAVTGASVAFVVPAIQALMLEAPGADIRVDVGPSEDLMHGLMNGDYDFILSRVPPYQDVRQLRLTHGRVETIEFLLRPGHPLLQIAKPDLADLAGFGWVIQAPGTPIRQAVEEAFIANALPLPDEIVNTTSLLVMIAYLQSSDSLSPISGEVAELLRNSAAGGLRTIKTRHSIIIMPYHLIESAGTTLPPLAERLRGLVLQAMTANLR